MSHFFIRTSIVILIITLIMLLLTLSLSQTIPDEPYATLWSPNNFRGEDATFSALDFRTGIIAEFPIPALDSDYYIYLPTQSHCRLSYLQPQGSRRLNGYVFSMSQQSWQTFEVPLKPTSRLEDNLDVEGIWSPDETSLYLHYHSQYFIINMENNQPYPLPQAIWAVQWSPDSRYLAGVTFVSGEGNRIAVFDRKTEQIEIYDLSDYRWFSWSPDSRYLAGAKYIAREGSDLVILDVQAKQTYKLIEALPALIAQAKGQSALFWSPDSSQIAFIGQDDRELTRGKIYVSPYIVDLDNGTMQEIGNQSLTWQDNWRIIWSPDGSKLTYSQGLDERLFTTMAIHDLTTGRKADIPTLSLYNFANNQAWSTDGRYLAVIDSKLKLQIIDTVSQNKYRINNFVNQMYGWQDDNSLLFVTGLYNRYQETQIQIANINTDGMDIMPYTIPDDIGTVRIGICHEPFRS